MAPQAQARPTIDADSRNSERTTSPRRANWPMPRAHLPYDVSRGSHANQLQAADIRVCCCMYNSQRIQVAHQLSYAPIPIAVPSGKRHHFHISLHSLQASLLPQTRCVFTPRDTQQPASAATNTIKSAFAPVCHLGLRKTSQIIQILFATKHHQSSVTS